MYQEYPHTYSVICQNIRHARTALTRHLTQEQVARYFWLMEDTVIKIGQLESARRVSHEKARGLCRQIGQLRQLLSIRETTLLDLAQPRDDLKVQPPRNAELILHLILAPDRCDALVGDLDERFGKLSKRLGPRRARMWYRAQVFSSIWPLLKDTVRRAGSSTVIAIVGFGLRAVGLGTYADALARKPATKSMGKGGVNRYV